MKQKHSILKRSLMMTSTFVTGLVGYGRPVYAACVSTGAPNYLCSGVETTQQSIISSGGQIVADGTFSVIDAGIAMRIRDSGGDVSFIQASGSYINGSTGLAMSAGMGTYGGTFNLTAEINGTIRGSTGAYFSKDGEMLITNNGDIEATGTGISINAGNAVSAEGTTLINTSSIYGAFYGVTVQSNTGGLYINNSGDIHSGQANYAAIRINGGDGGRIVNTGDIIGNINNPGVGAAAIRMYNLTGRMDIDIVGGRIAGNIVEDNRDFAYVNILSNFTSEGNIVVKEVNVDTGIDFTMGQNSSISARDIFISGDINIVNTGNFIGGTMTVNNGGNLNIQEDLYLSGSLYNNGRISISSGKTFTANYMYGATGTLEFEVTGVGNTGFLQSNYTPLDLTGQTIYINVAAMDTLAHNNRLHLATGNGAIIGGPGSTHTAVNDSSVLWDFEIFDGTGIGGYGNNDLFARAFIPGYAVAFLSENQNNNNTGDVLVALNGNTTNPELLDVLAQMNSASTEEEFNDILESVQPAVDTGEMNASIEFSEKIQDITSLRLHDLRNIKQNDSENSLSYQTTTAQQGVLQLNDAMWATFFDERNPEVNRFGLNTEQWAGVMGQYTKQGTRDGIKGYEMISGGGAMGVDSGDAFSNFVMGASLGYAYSDIDSDNSAKTDTKVNSYLLNLYGEYDLNDDVFVDGSLSYTLNKNKTTRHDVGGVVGLDAKGDFDSDLWGVSSSIGKHINYDDFIFTPSLGMNYLHYSSESYRETGAGGAGLNVTTKDLDKFELGVDFKASRNLGHLFENKPVVFGSAHIGYFHDFIGDNLEKTSSFIGGGASFATESPDGAKDRLSTGFGFDYFGKNNIDYQLSYNYDLKEDYNSHTAGFKTIFKF